MANVGGPFPEALEGNDGFGRFENLNDRNHKKVINKTANLLTF